MVLGTKIGTEEWLRLHRWLVREVSSSSGRLLLRGYAVVFELESDLV